MIKTIGLLMAVILTPTYTTDDLGHGVFEEPNMTAYATYNVEYDDFIWQTRNEYDPTPVRYEIVCSFDVDSVTISNYYTLLEGTITFNAEMVSKFGACAIEIRYGNSQILASTFAVSFFANNQFNFGFNNRFNSNWSRTSSVDGAQLQFSLENEDIEENIFSVYFYAYERNKDLLYQEYYDDGYNTGYNEGYDAGLNDNVFTLDWLTKGIAGFLDVDIFGTFGIGDILLLFLGAFLMIYLLKVFAGG